MVTNEIQDSIVFDKTEVDFGRVKRNKTVGVHFIYSGDKEIKSIRESCLCLSHRKVKFLDRTEITIWWDTSKSVNKSNKFKSWKRATVFFEDGSFQNLNLIAEIYE